MNEGILWSNRCAHKIIVVGASEVTQLSVFKSSHFFVFLNNKAN